MERLKYLYRMILRRMKSANMYDKGELVSRMMKKTSDFGLAVRVLQSSRMRYAVQPEIVSCPRGRRLLVLAPHQDDEIIGCGGVFQNSIKAGKEVQVIYLTDGAPPKMRGGERERYIKVRQDEARRVWEAMGGREPIFWDFPCRRLPLNEVAVDKIAGAIDDFKPDCLFIPFWVFDSP